MAAALAFGFPVQGSAQQTAISGSPVLLLQNALRDEPATVRRLASMQEVDATVIRLIPVQGTTGGRRRVLGTRAGNDRAALRSALDKATVEELDRPNGVDERQNTFSDYLQQNSIDPKSVLAVSITANPDDKRNPFVNIFYRKAGMRATQAGR